MIKVLAVLVISSKFFPISGESMADRVDIKKTAIALGSNLGDSFAILEGAIAALDRTPQITVKNRSSWYKTVAIGPAQPDYLNGCAILEVQLTPQALLQTLLKIEAQFGRIRQERWGPRILDLDILLFEDLILDSAPLTLPHPHMTERAFVLVPLAEIAPDWIEPISKQPIAQWVTQVDCSGISLWTYPELTEPALCAHG